MLLERLTLPSILALAATATVPAEAAQPSGSSLSGEVQKYLVRYQSEARRHYVAREDARWRLLTSPAYQTDDGAAVHAAEKAWADFVGRVENIELSRTYLRRGKEIAAQDLRCLSLVAHAAQGAPRSVAGLVDKRLDALDEALGVFRTRAWEIAGEPTTRAEAARILREERDLALRRAAWEAVYEVGSLQKPTLVRLRWLQNEIVRALGVRDWFTWRASEYGLGSRDLQRALDGVLGDLRPLQRELLTFLRHELARLHELPVPDVLPAHWLPLPGEEESVVAWLGLGATGERDAAFEGESTLALVERADRMWESLGFTPLPPAFYERSSLGLPTSLARGAFVVRDLDRNGDVRAAFEALPGRRGWFDALRVVGETQCVAQTLQANVPFLLRTGANRSFHAALAQAIALGASQSASLRSAGVTVPIADDASAGVLLAEALRFLMPLFRSGGTICEFERALYQEELAPDAWNARYWDLVARWEGIAPPSPRDERWCDPAAHENLFAAAATGYDEAFATVIAFEIHDHVARKLLDADAHAVDLFGRRDVGDFVKSIARFGATVDWRTKLREKLGYELSARAILDYFEPLHEWLARRNAGRNG